jgi:AcrR family transcriptional regulator
MSSPTPAHPARDAARTREQLLQVARGAFARHGYDGTTVRSIAASAGVAPNLITRYFGGKAGLYRAATAVELDVASCLPGELSALGQRIARKVVQRWEGATPEDPLLMMVRSAGTSDEAARALARFFHEEAAGPTVAFLVDELGWKPAEAIDRVAAVGALIMGVVTMRYVMGSGPLAGASPAALEAWLGDRLQRMLEDPPPPPLTAAGRRGRVRRLPAG